MKCPNCGYEYNDSERKCPFCATENTAAARRQQQEVFRALEKEKQDIERLPEEMLRRTSKKTAKIFGILLAAILALTVLTLLGSLISRLFSGWSTDRHIQKMEELLLSEDYRGMTEYYDELDSYEAGYDKYREIASVCRQLIWMEESYAWIAGSSGEAQLYNIASCISDCMDVRAKGQPCLDDGLILGNEAIIEEMIQYAEDMLAQTFFLTDEEILEMETLHEKNDYTSDDVLPYAELAMERMEK